VNIFKDIKEAKKGKNLIKLLFLSLVSSGCLGYKLMEFAPIVVLLNTLLHKKPKDTLSTVRNKYSHKIFHQVTSIPLMDVNALFEKFTDVTQKLSISHLTYQTVIATCSASSSNVEGKSCTKRSNRKTKDAPLSTKAMPVPLIR
jgi:hypothetical protein